MNHRFDAADHHRIAVLTILVILSENPGRERRSFQMGTLWVEGYLRQVLFMVGDNNAIPSPRRCICELTNTCAIELIDFTHIRRSIGNQCIKVHRCLRPVLVMQFFQHVVVILR